MWIIEADKKTNYFFVVRKFWTLKNKTYSREGYCSCTMLQALVQHLVTTFYLLSLIRARFAFYRERTTSFLLISRTSNYTSRIFQSIFREYRYLCLKFYDNKRNVKWIFKIKENDIVWNVEHVAVFIFYNYWQRHDARKRRAIVREEWD